MNTPEEHAAAVMRAPGQITVASIAGAIRAYADEIKGSQIADADKLAAVTAERDAEREARRALAVAVSHAGLCACRTDVGSVPCVYCNDRNRALALAAKLLP